MVTEQTPEKLRKTEQVSYDIWQSANVCLQDICCGDVHLKFFPINVQNYVVEKLVILHLSKTKRVSYDIWQSANVCLQDVCCGDVHLKFFPINVQNYVVQKLVILHLSLTFMRAHIEQLLLVMYGCV